MSPYWQVLYGIVCGHEPVCVPLAESTKTTILKILFLPLRRA